MVKIWLQLNLLTLYNTCRQIGAMVQHVGCIQQLGDHTCHPINRSPAHLLEISTGSDKPVGTQMDASI